MPYCPQGGVIVGFENNNYFNIADAELDYDFGDNRQKGKTVDAPLTPDEALIDCINTYGTVDLRYMSDISGLSIETLISELRGKAIFQDPEVFRGMLKWSMEDGWLLAPRYLSGNIPEKYAVALKVEEHFPGCFEANIEALQRLMPAKLELEDIHVSLGASWVPSWIYADFIFDLLHLNSPPQVYFNKELSTWKIESVEGLRNSVTNNYTTLTARWICPP